MAIWFVIEFYWRHMWRKIRGLLRLERFRLSDEHFELIFWPLVLIGLSTNEFSSLLLLSSVGNDYKTLKANDDLNMNSPSGFLPGIFGFQTIGAASILIEHVCADRTVSKTATRRFRAFWIKDVTESRPETTSSPATCSTSCLTRARTLSWCWRGSIFETWSSNCCERRLSVHSSAIGRASERNFLP